MTLNLNFYNVINASIDIKKNFRSFNLSLNDPNDLFEEKLNTILVSFFNEYVKFCYGVHDIWGKCKNEAFGVFFDGNFDIS